MATLSPRIGVVVRAGPHPLRRLSVFRSHKHTMQVIDDEAGRTLASAGTPDKASVVYGGNKSAAEAIGKLIAERPSRGREKGRLRSCEYKYHGRIAALADAARKAGLEF